MWSDVRIICRDREWPAHTQIICRNTYFHSAFNEANGFKESVTGILDLGDDDPDMVEALLKHMYDIDYHNNGWADLADTYVFGEKYNCETLKMDAHRGMRRTLLSIPDNVSMSIADLRTLVHKVYTGTPDTDRHMRDLIVHFAFCDGQLFEPNDKAAVMQLMADYPEFNYDIITLREYGGGSCAAGGLRNL